MVFITRARLKFRIIYLSKKGNISQYNNCFVEIAQDFYSVVSQGFTQGIKTCCFVDTLCLKLFPNNYNHVVSNGKAIVLENS